MRDYVYDMDGLEPYVVADVQMEALGGSLADLLKTVQEMIGQYGADAMIQFQGGCVECGEIEGSVRRRATAEEIAALAAYISSLAPGPAIPTDEQISTEGADLASGGELFRTNCSQCHNFAGRGGALSDGSYAPSLLDADNRQVYEAMLTGPQQMPVFSNETLTPEDKQDILKYIESLRTAPNPGGQDLGSLGPVTEGLFAWIAGLGLFIAVAIWIGAKVR